MILQLDEEVLSAEGLDVPFQHLSAGFHTAVEDGAGNLAGHTGGGGDDAFVMFFQEFMVHAGIIIEAFQLGGAGDLEQVLIADFVLSQQQQVIAVLVFLRVAVGHAAGGYIGFESQDRFDAGVFAGVIELDHTKHGAVVGDRQRVHAHFFGAVDKLLDLAKAVEQRIFGMNMQVSERRHNENSKLFRGILVEQPKIIIAC